MTFLTRNVAPPPPPGPVAAPSAAPVFRADRPAESDAGTGVALDHAAELVAHAGAETPFAIGLFGAAGVGKSHAVERLVARARALAVGAGGGPFLSRFAVARVAAGDAAADPATAIAAAVHSALSAPEAGFGAFASAAARASTDPHTAAREANRQLDDTRRQLDAERRARDDMESRRARLGEVLLYESAGSPVDAYARANRGAIEARLRRFGFTGDAVATYKDLVRDVADQPGAMGRAQVFLRALWAFGGQARLIVWAILLFLAAWGVGVARETSATWHPWLRDLSEYAAPAAEWLRAHLDLFEPARQALIALALLLLLANLWRAARFVAPLFRGARLLAADVEGRRRDLDGLMAHQTRRVDALAAEVDAHARNAAEAEARARETAQAGPGASAERLFGEAEGTAGRRARAYLAAVEAGITRGQADAPQRVLVVLDELDALAPARAAELAEAAQRLAARPGFAMLLCADAAHLAAGWSGPAEAARRLQRLVQIPLSIALAGGEEALEGYARDLLTGRATPAPAPQVDASRSVLDMAVTQGEADFIGGLAPLAGATPRAVKRFVNIYRLARARGGDLPALALMLALDCGGTTGELAAMGAAMDMDQPGRDLLIHPGEPRLAAAVAAVNAARGRALTIAEAQAAWGVASDYRTPL